MPSIEEYLRSSGRTLRLVGDSHYYLYHEIPGAVTHHLGPITMFRVGRDGMSVLDLPRYEENDTEIVGFLFGEIDIRCHVSTQVEAGRDYADVLEHLATSYISTIDDFTAHNSSIRVIVFSVVPPAGTDYANFDANFPRGGSDEERVRWTKVLNAFLAQRCLQRRYGYVDQFEPFRNEQGLLAADVSVDGVHIKPSLHDQVIFPLDYC